MVHLTVDQKKAEIRQAQKAATDFLCAHSASWTPSTTRLTVGSVIYALEQSGYVLTKVSPKEGQECRQAIT